MFSYFNRLQTYLLLRTLSSLLFSGLLLFSCQTDQPGANVPDVELSEAQLAQRYCGSCHLFPEPDLLDKETWTGSVLPAMAWRLGIRDTSYRPLLGRNMNEQFLIQQAGIFPDSARLSIDSWQRIVNYYDSLAPAALPKVASLPAPLPSAPFRSFPVSLELSTGGLTTLLRQHPETGKIYLGDGTRMLYLLNEAGETEDFFTLPSPVSDIHFQPDGALYLLTVGNLNPHDEPLGKLVSMDRKGNIRPLIQDLNRPVHMTVHDLDQDGQDDIIICEFGNYIGRLSWFRRTGENTFEKKVLWENPGAVKTVVRDLDQDDRPDIIALMAQGREGVYAFYNQGDGRFGMKPLLQFSSVFGTSDFTLADVDRDGDEDLMVANGDNADLSDILKPYHGVRVYRNDGDYQFSEAYHYPMYGATRILSDDFDQDGDVDLVASAYFPDFEADDPQSFVYLENTSTDSLTFAPASLDGLDVGRWLVMEKMQQEDRPSIMLGAFNFSLSRGQEEAVTRWNGENVNLMLLERNISDESASR